MSIPVAHTGAAVPAIDIAPGMVELLSEPLAPFPQAKALDTEGRRLSVDGRGVHDDDVTMATGTRP